MWFVAGGRVQSIRGTVFEPVFITGVCPFAVDTGTLLFRAVSTPGHLGTMCQVLDQRLLFGGWWGGTAWKRAFSGLTFTFYPVSW